MIFNNPIIKGFNPDPSICRVGEDYFLVTSTFEFFPGVPIYHSKNLTDWKLINYCLTRKSQIGLENCRNSGGIFAPTIRYFNDCFYMTTTNTSNCGNFIVSTNDIYGKWSDPVYIEQGGIDPSLLFDEEKVYFCSAEMEDQERPCIMLCEIDITTGAKLTESKIISYGCGGRYPEAPHIYKIGSYYYLLLAEGGTEYGHMSTIQRSKSPYGPFESCPHNPILSHKDEMYNPIHATGHSDLFEDQNGNWWMVSLGIRRMKNVMLHNLGRETFLAPVLWSKDGWPVVGNNGVMELTMKGPLPQTPSNLSNDFMDKFESHHLDLNWSFIRNPVKSNYELHQGFMRLKGREVTLSDFAPTFMGIRQKEFEMKAETILKMEQMEIGTSAGITAFYNKDYYYALCILRETDAYYIKLIKTVHGYTSEALKLTVEAAENIALEIVTGMDTYEFYYTINNKRVYVGEGASAGLATEATMTMTFTGTFIGIYALDGNADFKEFSIKAIK